MNSAAFVLNFFLNGFDGSEGEQFKYSDLVTALADVDNSLTTAAANGDEEAKLAIQCINGLWDSITTEFSQHPSTGFITARFSLNTESQMALRIAERILAAKVGEYSPERRDSIKKLIEGIPELLSEMTLPQELKLYVLRLTREVETALEEYAVTSDFKLDLAFSRLQTCLNTVAVVPKPEEEQGKFITFLNNKLIPCLMAVSLFADIGYTGIETYQFFAPRIAPVSQQTSAQ
ncbi:hypothetical protein CRD60_01050 [Bifidobacterium aemilianum]|uniref:Uncharacterized protein n=1 Tax=Bifidobacterium aemilianum TaxID=2493120 RepID=A0A366K9W0_9BIFI|nr:hypothetical protein [Bifidobacterium aemilianum]RBP98484.1 hypothetical protein CRD60_01050 [Bifidobacterium aemilianum]